ncbi:retrotransposon protein, putative, ty1-copia subclass [Tanacetum coccineum]
MVDPYALIVDLSHAFSAVDPTKLVGFVSLADMEELMDEHMDALMDEHMDEHDMHGFAIGNGRSPFALYVGAVTKAKISILIDDWRKVPKTHKIQFWLEIKHDLMAMEQSFLEANKIKEEVAQSLHKMLEMTKNYKVEPPEEGKLSNAQVVQAVEAWKHSDFLCHNYVLNGLLRMERLNLGNSPTANIKGKGDVIHIWKRRQRDDNDLQYERQDQPKEEKVEPRRSKRARIEKSFGPDFVSFMVENEPTSYREAKKYKADDTIDKCKARLVIKRFRQCEGLDFFDTYLLVTRITSIRMVLAIVALRKLEVHQMDMEITFLNGDLESKVLAFLSHYSILL